MFIQVLKSKIHRATVTDIDLDYSGSIGIDAELMRKAGLAENEKVLVANLRDGNRWETYAFSEKAKSRKVCVYGPAGRLCKVGDRIVIMAFAIAEKDERINPKIVILDKQNHATQV